MNKWNWRNNLCEEEKRELSFARLTCARHAPGDSGYLQVANLLDKMARMLDRKGMVKAEKFTIIYKGLEFDTLTDFAYYQDESVELSRGEQRHMLIKLMLAGGEPSHTQTFGRGTLQPRKSYRRQYM